MIRLSDSMLEHLSNMTSSEVNAAATLMQDPHNRAHSRALLPLLPTLRSGQFENLKLEWQSGDPESESFSEYRFWVSRMTKEDGASCDQEINLEHRYVNGWRRAWGWRTFSHGSGCSQEENHGADCG